MTKQFFFSFVLTFCICLVQNSFVSAQDRGYWALEYTKVVYDGKRSDSQNAGIRDCGPNFLDFTVLNYSKTTTYDEKDKPTVNGEVIVDPKNTKEYYDQINRASSGDNTIRINTPKPIVNISVIPKSLYFKWTTPDTYIPVGEENKIYIDHSLTNDNIIFSKNPFHSAKEMTPFYIAKNGRCDYAWINEGVTVRVLPELSSKHNYDFVINTISKKNSAEDISKSLSKYIDSAEKEAGKHSSDWSWACLGQQGSEEEGLLMKGFARSSLAEGRFQSFDNSWNMTMPMSKNAVMIVEHYAAVTYFQDGSKTDKTENNVRQYFIYKCYPEGGDREVTTYASAEEGEDGGTTLPPWIPVVPFLPFLPWAWKKISNGKDKAADSKNKNTKKEEKKELKKEEKKEEKKKPSSYEMIIYKEFGDTLKINDEPQFVGARIEEITPEGQRIDRPDLTSKIEVSEGENIKILAIGTRGRYRCAQIYVPSTPKDSNQGTIYFTFRDGGSLRNKYVFKIADPQIEFFQENLTLPAVYEEESRLPFVIKGISLDLIDYCEASFDNDEYTVDIERSDEYPFLWFAVINEKNKKPLDKPGESTYHILSVQGYTKDGGKFETTFPVIRLQMGLYFGCPGHISCYVEPYDMTKHSERLKIYTGSGTDLAPAQVFATFSLLTWNEETHRVIRVLPDEDPDTKEFYTLTVLPSDSAPDFYQTSAESRGTMDKTEEEFISSLEIRSIIDTVEDDYSVRVRLFSTQFMDAPSRRKAKVMLTMKYKGEEYSAEREVWLISMPLRDMSNDKLKKEWEIDEEIKDQLYYIKASIKRMGVYNNLFPVVKTIDLMLDGYHPKFGFDASQLRQVISTYNRFCRGEIIGANAEAEGVEDIGFLAETMRAFAKTGTQIEDWMEAHGGWKTRMALGLITLGWSETAITACNVQKKMIDVVEREKDPGGAWEAFFVGVQEVGKEYLQDLVMGELVNQSGTFMKHTSPELYGKIQKGLSDVGGKVQQKLGYLGKDVRDVYKDIKGYATEKFGKNCVNNVENAADLLKNSDKRLDQKIHEFRKKAVYTEEEILVDLDYNASLQDSLKTVQEYEKVYLEWAANRTQENLKRVEEYVLKIQSSKVHQRALCFYNGKWGNNLRARFYDMQQPINAAVQKKAAEYIAEEMRARGYKVDADDIYAFHATNSKAEALHNGNGITRDLDVSEKVRGKSIPGGGEPVDFDVPQDIAESCYARAYKEQTGYTIKQNDHAVVQTGSPEMIGCGESDLQKAFDRTHMRENFTDPQGVANACSHKVNEWVEQSYTARQCGYNNYGHLMEEGIRQGGKMSDTCIIPMAVENNCLSKIDPDTLDLMKSMKRMEINSTGPNASLSMLEFKKFIKQEYGLEIWQVGDKLKEAVLQIENFKGAANVTASATSSAKTISDAAFAADDCAKNAFNPKTMVSDITRTIRDKFGDSERNS